MHAPCLTDEVSLALYCDRKVSVIYELCTLQFHTANTSNFHWNICYLPSTMFPIMGTVLLTNEKKQAFNTVYTITLSIAIYNLLLSTSSH